MTTYTHTHAYTQRETIISIHVSFGANSPGSFHNKPFFRERNITEVNC